MSQAMMRRAKEQVRFKNEDMDYFFLWVLGAGGLDVGEAFYIASQIRDGSPESWSDQFRAFARRLEDRAKQLQQAGKRKSAGETRFKAFCADRYAAQFMNVRQPAFRECVETFKRNFQQSLVLLGAPVSPVEIPFEGKTLPGLFMRSPSAAGRLPTLLMIGGGDTYVEDLYGFVGPVGLQRGYNVLAVDLPGQGATPFNGQFFRPDYETPVRAVVDWISSRPEVDMERLAIYGLSGGGYMVTRATAYEHRIRACIANTPLLDVARLLTQDIPKALQNAPGPFTAALIHLAGAVNEMGKVNLEKFYWQGGVNDFQEFVKGAQAAKVDPALIACPYLCLAGEGDPPSAIEQTNEVYSRLSSPKKAIRIFTVEEGADAHCTVNNLSLMRQVLFDWLDDVLANDPFMR